jgi:hypothetical protein
MQNSWKYGVCEINQYNDGERQSAEMQRCLHCGQILTLVEKKENRLPIVRWHYENEDFFITAAALPSLIVSHFIYQDQGLIASLVYFILFIFYFGQCNGE